MNLVDPVLAQVVTVVSRERSTVGHEGGRQQAVTNQVLILGIKLVDSGLPRKFLVGETLHKLLTAINLGLKISQDGTKLLKSGDVGVILLLELDKSLGNSFVFGL